MKVFVVLCLVAGALGSLEPAGYQPPATRYLPANRQNTGSSGSFKDYRALPSQQNPSARYLPPFNSQQDDSIQVAAREYLPPISDRTTSVQYKPHSSSSSSSSSSFSSPSSSLPSPTSFAPSSYKSTPSALYSSPSYPSPSSSHQFSPSTSYSSLSPSNSYSSSNSNFPSSAFQSHSPPQYPSVSSFSSSDSSSAALYSSPSKSDNFRSSSSFSSPASSFSSPSHQSSPSASASYSPSSSSPNSFSSPNYISSPTSSYSYSSPQSDSSASSGSNSSPSVSQSYSPSWSSSTGSNKMATGIPATQYLSPNAKGYSSGRDYQTLEDSEPANYNFEYRVNDEYGNDFGHKENRQDEKSYGVYSVLLPDGRKQIVEYEADEDGFRPKISYEEIGGGFKNARDQAGGPY